MKRLLLILALLSSASVAQTAGPISGFCTVGGKKVTISGLTSVGTVQASYPRCTVTVFVHGGGGTKETIYADSLLTPLTNPFTANLDGSFTFYINNSDLMDVTLSGGDDGGFASPFTYIAGDQGNAVAIQSKPVAVPSGTNTFAHWNGTTIDWSQVNWAWLTGVGTAGQRPTVNTAATSAPFETPIAVEAREFPGADCGAKINAADAYLTATYGANIGSIVVDKNCGQTINTTVIINGHGLRFLAGSGTFTSNLSGSSLAVPFRLKSNSSLICDDWSTTIQESSTVGARQTIVDTFNAQAANLHDDNILVQGCHLQGANAAYSGAVQTIELGNCHNCRVVGNFFDAVRGIAVGIGGASGSTYADNVWATDNLVINGPTQIFAVVNGQNWHISRNISTKPGAGDGSTVGSTVDIEPNSNTDKAGPGEITYNIFDFRGATAMGAYPITVTTWEAPGILISGNDLIGGLLPTETGGPTRNIPSCISVLAHSPSSPTGLRVTNNHCSMTTLSSYVFTGVIGSEIANNLAICPGGGNGYIRMEDGSQNNNIHSNSFTDPCGGSSSVNENIEEDGASISNNRIWGNLATRATLIAGNGSTEAYRIDPTTGLMTADSFVTSGPNGGSITTASISENITLSTSGTTTDSSANLLPANATINAVGCRVSTTITTATDWSVGDASTAARFGAANSVMTAGSTTNSTGTAWTTGVASATTGIKQGAAAKLRITTTGTPGAGAIRCTVFYSQPTPPTS